MAAREQQTPNPQLSVRRWRVAPVPRPTDRTKPSQEASPSIWQVFKFTHSIVCVLAGRFGKSLHAVYSQAVHAPRKRVVRSVQTLHGTTEMHTGYLFLRLHLRYYNLSQLNRSIMRRSRSREHRRQVCNGFVLYHRIFSLRKPHLRVDAIQDPCRSNNVDLSLGLRGE